MIDDYTDIIVRPAADFEAVPSGDHESFCWDVARDEFIRLMGRQPREYEKSCLYANLYRIYPGIEVPDLMPGHENFVKVKVECKWNKTRTKFSAKMTMEVLDKKPRSRKHG